MTRTNSASRTRRLAVGLVLVGGAACGSLLDVTNPATFGEDALLASTLAPQLIGGVVTRYQSAYDDLALYSAIITDEAVSGHNFETIRDVDLRKVTKLNSSIYEPLQRVRATADSFNVQLKRVYGDSANSSLGVARVQAYGASSYVLAGEFLCESPVDPNGPKVSNDSMFRIAVSQGTTAIATATAYRAKSGASTVAADSIINFARVTVARAHLNLGNNAAAATFASQVPATFQLSSFYDQNNSSNIFLGATSGTNRYLGVDVAFRNLDDARVRHSATGSTGHDQSTILFTPSLSPSFGGFSTATAGVFSFASSIRISSGLEAQYIKAEAQGPTAENIAFLEGRRTSFPSSTATEVVTAANFVASLRDQRRRDFFLDGHRLGDLRRYIKFGNTDLFPKGLHPNQIRGGSYGTSVCFPPTDAEIVGNPAYKP